LNCEKELISAGAVGLAHPFFSRERAMSNIKTTSDEKTKEEPGASIDEQVDDSFPASDPPSYNAGGRVGRPDRAKEKDTAKATRSRKQNERATKAAAG
jgi:hypothetical protein